MSEKRNMKEVVEKALEEILSKRKEYKYEFDKEENEEEVVIEPLMVLDPELVKEIGEINEFTNLSDIIDPEACPSVEIDEEDNVPDQFVPTESLLDIADEIKPLDADNIILCDVGGTERILVNGENCNMQRIPLLKLVLLTPPNLQIIDDIIIKGNTANVEDIELQIICNVEGHQIVVATDIKSLTTVGLLTVLIDDEEETIPTFTCSPIEWRGMVNKISLEELESIFNN